MLNDIFKYEKESFSFIVNQTNRGTRAREGQPSGGLDSKGYLSVKVNGKLMKVHRIVWMLHFGEIPDGQEIDHIDRNKYNNDITNLRLADRYTNNQNRSSKNSGKKLNIIKSSKIFKVQLSEGGSILEEYEFDSIETQVHKARTMSIV